ncbi:MAG TPA: PIG-L deacetylase family protein [Myxococcota bacterium]|nr:PIG-L deacetylase family protein [Myxococcota bacterium]
MLKLDLVRDPDAPFRVLALGAHCDDIEIGCGGTLLRLARLHRNLYVDWVVFSSSPVREREARASAERFLEGAKGKRVVVHRFRNGYFPDEWAAIKDAFEAQKGEPAPDLVLTHHAQDLHQDHRTLAELTWNTCRDHLILEYEVPKYDGDLGSPNFFVRLDDSLAARKARHIVEGFPSQADKHWFREDTFLALMRLRGVQCGARYAEGFYARKVCS